MPLVWAHAEHVKLCRSLADNAVFDMPPQTVRRYLTDKTVPRCAVWRPDLRVARMAPGRVLRIDLPAAAVVHWSADGWRGTTDTPTGDSHFGFESAELPTATLAAGACVVFTWRDAASGAWAGENYEVAVG